MIALNKLLIKFQSTLPREERPCLLRFTGCRDDFNPRSHERSDGKYADCYRNFKHFNPRSHERSDSDAGMERLFSRFQSTLPREERQKVIIVYFAQNDFNPRSHERSDSYSLLCSKISKNFNPRSHERSDLLIMPLETHALNFNPRSHERSDNLELILSKDYQNFNPRSHERSDRVHIVVSSNQ